MAFDLSKEMIMWIVRVIFLVVISLILVAIVGSKISRDLEYYSINNELLRNRMLFDDDCFSYEYGSLDFNKFNEQVMEKCLRGSNNGILVKLYDLENNPVKEVKYNVGRLDDLIFCGKKRFDNIHCFSSIEYIPYYEAGLRKEGIVKIEMVGIK